MGARGGWVGVVIAAALAACAGQTTGENPSGTSTDLGVGADPGPGEPDAAVDADPVTTDDAAAPTDGDGVAAVDSTTPADVGGEDDLAGVPPATVRGTVRIFGPPGGPLEGATIGILEHPERSAVTGADGRFELTDVPGGDVTLVLTADGYPENQLGTHRLQGEDLERLDFQAVSQTIYDIFAVLANAAPDPARCQISSTVTRWFEGSLPAVHGEPGATVSIEPSLPAEHGPTYFNADVLPTPGLTETTVDGGVVWTNAPPGTYVIRAHKPGVTFEDVRIKCRAGVLVNAAPPWGLQALVPGSGY